MWKHLILVYNKKMDIRRKPKGEKICRGAYNYTKRDHRYAEEEFVVYKDRKELSMSMFAYLYARIPTGELLTTYVDYIVNKDYSPQNLYMERTLGKSVIQENYAFNPLENKLTYHYSGPQGIKTAVVTTPSKFTLTTPTTSTSFTFLRTKKEDTLGKNYYTVMGTDNYWKYEHEPYTKVVAMERTGIGSASISIEGKSLQSIPYKLYDGEDLQKGDNSINAPYLNVYLSKIVTIPYIVDSNDGTKIQIRYLNDLDNQ